MPTTKPTPKPLQVAAAVIGNALEWYDFIIFGFLTVVIARLFFPSDTQYASLLLTTATFGVGFFMRPVGGVVLGLYADHKGRKAALSLIIGLMTAVRSVGGGRHTERTYQNPARRRRAGEGGQEADEVCGFASWPWSRAASSCGASIKMLHARCWRWRLRQID